MSDLKNGLLSGTSLPSTAPSFESLIDPTKLVVVRDGRESIVTHLSIEQVAREFAGAWFERDRSRTFRQIWGTSDKAQLHYVDKNWRGFIGDARKHLTEMLNSPGVPQDWKDQIYDALRMQNAVDQLVVRESGSLQIMRGTQAWDGDKTENKLVDEEGRGAVFIPE